MDHVSHVPANRLVNPVYQGTAEIQVGSGPWMQYWCAVHNDCLYVYRDQESQSSIRTIVLPGYEVQTLAPTSKRQFMIQLHHSGVPPISLSASDALDMQAWLEPLLRGSQASSHQTKVEPRQRALHEEAPVVAAEKTATRVGDGATAKRVANGVVPEAGREEVSSACPV